MSPVTFTQFDNVPRWTSPDGHLASSRELGRKAMNAPKEHKTEFQLTWFQMAGSFDTEV
jgi:hypothetical protein